jgi:hypothetical protein
MDTDRYTGKPLIFRSGPFFPDEDLTVSPGFHGFPEPFLFFRIPSPPGFFFPPPFFTFPVCRFPLLFLFRIVRFRISFHGFRLFKGLFSNRRYGGT